MIDSVTIEDLNNLIKIDFIDWEKLRDSSVLITGATGQIGSEIVKLLLYLNEKKSLNINIIAYYLLILLQIILQNLLHIVLELFANLFLILLPIDL